MIFAQYLAKNHFFVVVFFHNCKYCQFLGFIYNFSTAICLYFDELLYTVSQKNKQNYFFYNNIKLPPNVTIFVTKMANSLKLYMVHSFSTSPNSRLCTTVLNADVPNCYTTL